MNQDSNYRKYYAYDMKFFLKVIDKEQPPHEFKIHLFNREKFDEDGNPSTFGKSTELLMLSTLDKFNAQDVRITVIDDKLRVTFKINEPENAK